MSNIIKRDFHGMQIAFEGNEQANLTDLWKAAGSPAEKDPYQWSRYAGSEFIETASKNLNGGKSPIMKTKRGKGGGTWAHWQIALTYAQYLSPELHMFVNQCFVERVQEEQNPDLAIERGNDRAIRQWKKQGKSDEWIAARIRAKIAQKENSKILQKHGDDGRVFSICADAMNKKILGKTARQFKESKNLPDRAQTRDYVDAIQLAELELSAMVSARRIRENSIYGNSQCENVHEIISGRVHEAVTMRGI